MVRLVLQILTHRVVLCAVLGASPAIGTAGGYMLFFIYKIKNILINNNKLPREMASAGGDFRSMLLSLKTILVSD
jgi:hypothetical protein